MNMFQPIRRFLSVSAVLVLGILLLPHLSSAQVQSNDPNFTPAVLKSGLSFPDGVVFRPPTGDLLVSVSGQILKIDAASGNSTVFASLDGGVFPDKVAVRSSDGLVAVITGPFGSVAFFSSNGTSQGTADLGGAIIAAFQSSFTGTTVACVSGLSFDTNGNLFVAAGPGSAESNGCTLGSTWSVYKFAASTLLTATPTPTHVTTFPESVVIQDMVFTAARPPLGTLYAIDSEFGGVYEISLTPECGECSIFASSISSVSTDVNPRGIAIDPLLGDIYVSEFEGTEILKIPAPGNQDGDSSPTTFAHGFSSSGTGDTLRLAFDTLGNLYVNEITAGNLWKFTRSSNATTQQPLTPGKINALTFINPNPTMSDQVQTMLIPASANLNGAAFIQDIFVSVDPATLNATLSGGTTGDTAFFGGAPVPAGTTCAQVPSANSNCVVVVQKCYDANHNPFDICPVQEPSTSTDLIQLTFTYAGAQTLLNPAFLIGFDNGDGQDITDITIADCCSGGTKGLCSKTFDASLPAGSGDFSLTISPDPVILTANSTSATVTVTSLNSFASTISLVVSDVPAGFSASLSPTSVNLTAGGTPTSGLTVGISTSATTSGIATTIGNLLAAGCIDNAEIANALTSKVSAAQAAIGTGQIRTAINILAAFNSQVQAQAGKHISASCTTTFPLIVMGTATTGEIRLASTNITFTPATVLTGNVLGLISFLGQSADPITGFVLQGGSPVVGATVNLLNSALVPVAIAGNPATTDATGFYYFANTNSLTKGASYTVQVVSPPAQQTFTWMGKGLAFNFTLP
jgi:hypothetical protein